MALMFTPKKFLDAMELNGIKLAHLIEWGVERSYFIPRYKTGSHRIKDLDYSYRKGIEMRTIEKIATVLLEMGIVADENTVKQCFLADNYDILLPEGLL